MKSLILTLLTTIVLTKLTRRNRNCENPIATAIIQHKAEHKTTAKSEKFKICNIHHNTDSVLNLQIPQLPVQTLFLVGKPQIANVQNEIPTYSLNLKNVKLAEYSRGVVTCMINNPNYEFIEMTFEDNSVASEVYKKIAVDLLNLLISQKAPIEKISEQISGLQRHFSSNQDQQVEVVNCSMEIREIKKNTSKKTIAEICGDVFTKLKADLIQ
jgi:hypothetical protein